MKRTLLPAVLSLLGASAAHAAACESADHKAFDFWVGEWNVYGPRGGLAGANSIRKEYGGCVLHERYDTGRGYSGESLNAWDAGRKVWHQTWVDNSGLLLLLEGGLQGRSMVMQGQTVATGGAATRHRITWTPNEDGTVRQLWESAEGGADWKVLFDGKYVKKAAP